MDREIGIVASLVFAQKISWDTLVAVHHNHARHLNNRYRFNDEAELIRRLHETLTEQFRRETNAPDVIMTFITYLIDCPLAAWPEQLKELSDRTVSAA